VSTHQYSPVNVSGGTNPIDTSAFGPYTPTAFYNNFTNILPSASLKFDLRKDLVMRFSAAQTMARPDYSAIGGAVSLTDLNWTGNGGNPNLKPIKSANYDGTLEWYFGAAVAALGRTLLHGHVVLRRLQDEHDQLLQHVLQADRPLQHLLPVQHDGRGQGL
jgi:outer membrane receptor protein involved in Fe transport